MTNKDFKLFFYSNTNTLRSYLARGIIACNTALQPHVHERTLGNLSNNALFLTHLMLKPDIIHHGLENDENLYPVILEIQILVDSSIDMPVHFLQNNGSFIEGDLKNYNPTEYLGAFITGYLPFSMVSALLFETGQNRDAFYDPSPNLWFPEDLFKVLSQAERKKFKDNLEIDVFQQQGEALDCDTENGQAHCDLPRSIHLLEKHKAIALVCTQTARSTSAEELVNFDELVLRIFELELDAIRLQLPPKVRASFTPKQSPGMNDLLKVFKDNSVHTGKEEEASANRIIFAASYTYFLRGKRAFIPDSVLLMQQIKSALTENEVLNFDARLIKTLERIEQYFAGSNGISISKELDAIPSALPALKGLVLVLKNSSEFRVNHFMDELRLFRLTHEEKRFAMVLYAALNGLNAFEGSFKDKFWLNRLAESYAAQQGPHQKVFDGVYSNSQYSSILPKAARLPASNKTGFVIEIKPLVNPSALKILLINSLKSEDAKIKILEVLRHEIKTKTELSNLTDLEYHQQKSDQIELPNDINPVLRFKTAATEVQALNTQRFKQEWLEDGVFENRLKKARDRKILLAIYNELAGETT